MEDEVPQEEAPADAQPEAAPEPAPDAPPAEEPAPVAEAAPAEPEAAPPAEAQSFADLIGSLLKQHEERLAALEGVAHSNHNIDPSVIEQLASLVLERIGASIRSHLG